MPKPKRPAPDAVLWIYEDPARGLALVRGKNVRVVLESAVVVERARWSVSGDGFVLPIGDVPDVVAMAQWNGYPVRFKPIGEAS